MPFEADSHPPAGGGDAKERRRRFNPVPRHSVRQSAGCTRGGGGWGGIERFNFYKFLRLLLPESQPSYI